MSREHRLVHSKDPAQMTDKLKESVSALMDNEASLMECRRVLKQSDTHPEVNQAWDDYHLIGQVMRQGASADLDLSAGVMQRLQLEAGEAERLGSAGTEPKQRWYQRLTSQVAVAAGVAAAVLVGVNVAQDTTLPQATLASTAPSFVPSAPVSVPSQLALPAATFGQTQNAPIAPVNQALQSQLKAQIDAYLVRHAENAAATGGQGLLPLARVMRPQTEEDR